MLEKSVYTEVRTPNSTWYFDGTAVVEAVANGKDIDAIGYSSFDDPDYVHVFIPWQSVVKTLSVFESSEKEPPVDDVCGGEG